MKRVLFSTLFATLLVSAGYYFYFSLPDVSVLKQRNPNSTALMDLRDARVQKAKLTWAAPTNLGVLRCDLRTY